MQHPLRPFEIFEWLLPRTVQVALFGSGVAEGRNEAVGWGRGWKGGGRGYRAFGLAFPSGSSTSRVRASVGPRDAACEEAQTPGSVLVIGPGLAVTADQARCQGASWGCCACSLLLFEVPYGAGASRSCALAPLPMVWTILFHDVRRKLTASWGEISPALFLAAAVPLLTTCDHLLLTYSSRPLASTRSFSTCGALGRECSQPPPLHNLIARGTVEGLCGTYPPA